MNRYAVEYELKDKEESEDTELELFTTKAKANKFVNSLIKENNCTCIILKFLDEDENVEDTFEYDFKNSKWI